ncbi:MAG: hypothetical protein M3347_05300 [Armatimonadota bacterium]|nr:hypothetical protein [Armatimonadota bacterium]
MSRDTNAPAGDTADRRLSRSDRAWIVAPLVWLALILLLFRDVLFSPQALVPTEQGSDLATQFVYWRDFGFRHLRAGHLPLWNPHLFSGTPFFGNFQSALLYPPTYLHLFLPLATALNGEIMLHLFLMGLFVYLWTARRGLHPLACLLTSVLVMLGGPFFLHVYAGHLNNLAAMVWVPLLLLAVDGLLEKRSAGWWLLGTCAVTLQILAGHPQYVFRTAVAVTIYTALCLLQTKELKTRERLHVVFSLVSVYAGAAALAAVQLGAGWQVARESTRGGAGIPYEFAAIFSLPPENFLTLLAPAFFGNMTSFPYWGRCYLWEVSLFMGVAGLALALYGLFFGSPANPGHAIDSIRQRRSAAVMVILLLWLALGALTPLFKLLYTYVPGFNRFRVNAEFSFQAGLFIALLAGIGLDGLLRSPPRPRSTRSMAIFLLSSGLMVGIGGLWLRGSITEGASGAWGRIVTAVAASGESFAPPEVLRSPEFIRQAGDVAVQSLLVSSGLCLLLAALFFATGFFRKSAYLIALVALLEMVLFARTSRTSFDLATTRPTEEQHFLAAHPGDYRILNINGRPFFSPNSAMSSGAQDIWGYDPVILGRYAAFMAWTQKQNPNEVTMYLPFTRLHPLYRMLRCRYAFVPADNNPETATVRTIEVQDILPRLLLVHDYAVVEGRERIFNALNASAFDPRRQVILETTPEPKPVQAKPPDSKASGKLRLVDSSTDHLTIEAELPRPAILLITDSYSSGWRAVALPDSVQQNYELLPANYVLRAIPLAAGRHHLRVEYAPLAFQVGKWVSLVSLLLYVTLLGWYLRQVYRTRRPSNIARKLEAA